MTTPKRRRRAPETPIIVSDVIQPRNTGAPLAGEGGDSSPPSTPMSDAIRAQGGTPEDYPDMPPTTKRRRRSKVGGFSMKLSAPQREGETRRWVNDDGNRIAEMRELGYDFVSETGIQTADPGSRVSRLVGTKANGEPLHAYLMETPDELYAQGVEEKEAANRLIDEAITAGRDSTGRMDEHQYGHGSIKVER